MQKEITVTVPEYLYKESIKMAEMGLFRDLSEMVSAGLRRELREAHDLLTFEPEDWQEGLTRLRAQIKERKALYGYEEKSEEQVIAEIRARRRKIWEKEYRPRYTFGAR